ncbi:type II toxin-antitoxin system PrlF family antitoxin [Legionella feeleii]|uniref:Antitoxin PrlF n=1 Tax=Legionella feeleii TaxID=453 RepID=A0A0W0U723_9GAMM|nr:type II toxin-antitoxin system PrlF family antitoxin [Legionella feeleii]KTD03578.1 Antitoxin PrlF [Legionella feeleii]SPX59379.1 putative regulator [Legionella feeleii]
MSNSIIEIKSSLTDRYQTTIPETVRKALHLKKRDKLHYTIQGDGSVVITRVENEENDPVIEEFLSFLAKDIQKHPQNVMPLNSKLHQRIQSLVSGVEIDLDESLLDEDE